MRRSSGLGGSGALGRTGGGGASAGFGGSGFRTSAGGSGGGGGAGFGGAVISGAGVVSAGAAETGAGPAGSTAGGATGAGGAVTAAAGAGPAGSTAGGAAGAGSSIGASRVTTSGLAGGEDAPARRSARGLCSSLLSLSAAFARVRRVGAGVSAVSAGLAALGRALRRAAGLAGAAVPGRIACAGILATGCDSTSRARSSSTVLPNVKASIPAARSRSRTSLVVRRKLVARS